MAEIKLTTKKQLIPNSVKNQVRFLAVNYFNWIIAAAVAAVAVCGVIFLLKPEYEFINKGQDAIYQQSYLNKSDYFKRVIILRKAYEAIDQSSKDRLDGLVASAKENKNAVYDQLSTIAANNGLIPESINVVADAAAPLNLVPSDKKVQAGELLANMATQHVVLKLRNVYYDDLINIIHGIETNLRLMDVVSVDFQPAKKTAKIEFYTYQFKN